MLQHILVPLDGSTRAEHALPIAARTAKRTGGTIYLLRIVSSIADEFPSVSRAGALTDEVSALLVEEATTYLEHVAHSDVLAGIQVRTQTIAETPARAILTYAQTQKADLIVLCSHGYTAASSAGRWEAWHKKSCDRVRSPSSSCVKSMMTPRDGNPMQRVLCTPLLRWMVLH